MSFITPKQFTVEQFAALLPTLKWDKGWKPSFVTGHNTGRPTLAQWMGYSATTKRQWPANLNHYYKGLGWHSGPHLVICPKVDGGGIWQLCDLEADGVSVSCWNRKTIGIEMVGDFSFEDPTSGHGAEVRDQFIDVVTALCRRFGWTPRPQVLGKSGLHWHHQCTKDHHPCPGKRWPADFVIQRIEQNLAGAKP